MTSVKKTHDFTFVNVGVLLSVLGAILLRWCVSLGGYSGQNKPPLFGDYEAQRHWQEITLNLPVSEWYTNSSKNDLQYWGLDYPPLTAYHSWLCGYIASLINPEWVALESSRGTESEQHKLFMRYSVLVVDLLLFLPVVVLLSQRTIDNWKSKQQFTTSSFLIVLLFYPGLILIDYGHFQYNNFSLGLLLWCVFAFSANKHIMGSIFFCLALNYKQMELYHALPVFFFLLGRAFSEKFFNCVFLIGKLGVTVLTCFALLWAPYLYSWDSTLQVLFRLFPVGRGLYEDKVANFWCSISPAIKFKLLMDQQTLIRLCGFTTLLFSLPSCIHVMKNPTFRNLRFSLVNVSLVFFLFSYQVHEKSILIPAISACLLWNEVPNILIVWFLHFTVFSMSPLLMKDHLTMQQVATSVLFLTLTFNSIAKELQQKFTHLLTITMFWISIFLSGFLIFFPFFYEPPARYPDLCAVITSSLSCAVLMFCSFVFYFMQLKPMVKSKKQKTS